MNSWFFSHSRLYDAYWKLVANGYPAGHERNAKEFSEKEKDKAVPSRMALFIEMEDAENTESSGREGQSGEGSQQARVLKGDCVWEWSDVVCGSKNLEKGRFNFEKKDEGHFKGPVKYCNVVFVDGHVMAIPEDAEDKAAEWNDHADLDEVFKALGEGSY